MELTHAVLLFFASILAGAMNSVAGGGTFFTFPMLLFTGMPPIAANATNTMALWPGSIASVGAYRKELAASKALLPTLIIISFIGGLAGALILLATPEQTFKELIPWLLLVATLLFTFSPKITAYLRRHSPDSITPRGKMLGWCGQMVIAIYGGYFGGGIGILMLSMLSLMGLKDIHQMNGLKTLLATVMNGIAVVTFVIAGTIVWPQAILMMVGAIIGGYGGARLARRIPQAYIRHFITVTGFGLSAYFFMA